MMQRTLKTIASMGTGGGGVSAHAQLSGNGGADCHPMSAITGLDPALAGKSASGHNHDGAYAAIAHGHAIADTAGLQAALDAKAASSHTHAGLVVSARLTANRTTTATGMANITDLAIPIGASETWHFDMELHAGCNNTGGSQFSVAVPAGATVKVRAFGNTNAATAWTSGQISASDGASPTFLNVNAQGRMVTLKGVIVNGANAGSIQGRFKSVTNGQTTTVEANSYIKGVRH